MITSLYAGILGILYFKISFDTIKARRKHQVSLGHGNNNEITSIASAHHNFASYTVLLLLMTFLLEQSQAVPSLVIHLVAIGFTIGRILHYLALSGSKMNFKFRVIGMQLTLFPLMVLSILNIYSFFFS